MTTKKILPENISLEVTTYCDGRCNYCFALPGKENRSMSIEMARNILEEAFALNYRSLHITGGEPFLWKHLEELMEYAKSLGFTKIFINTGGRILNRKVRSLLSRFSDILSFSVTVNGPEEIHRQTRRDTKYDTTMRFLDLIQDLKITYQIFSVITRPLLKDLARFATELYEKFPDMTYHTWIQLHRAPGDPENLRPWILSPAEFVKMVHVAGILRKFGLPIRFLENPLASVAAGKLGFSLRSLALMRERKLSVLVDGSITGAHSSRKSHNMYTKGALRKTLESSAYRASIGESDVCRGCEFLSDCRNAGMLQPFLSHRDYDESEPFCVRVNRELTQRELLLK